MILSSSAIVHIDQASKVMGTAVNRWHVLTSALPLSHATTRAKRSKDGNATMKEEEKGIRVDEQKGTPLQLELQGTHLFFTDDAAGLVLMKDHKALPFRFLLDERSISALTLGALEYNDTIPAALSILDTDRARFVMTGSMVADTVLQRIDTVSAHAEEVDW
ncbi:unnamed protein product [Tilletia controversa]|nr:unnamed protein product [Tilletia controversa]CAD6972862.1 unnamed protein product [Tilletia controversa]